MALEFEWDSRKAAANLAKHTVSFEDAATVFGDPLGRIMADPRHSAEEERLVLVGPFAKQAFACSHVRGSGQGHSNHQRATCHTA